MEEQSQVTLRNRVQVLVGGTAVSLFLGAGSLFFHSFPYEQFVILTPILIAIAQGKPIYEGIQEARMMLGPTINREQFDHFANKIVQNENAELDQSAQAKIGRIFSLFSDVFPKNTTQPIKQESNSVRLKQIAEVIDPFEELKEKSGIVWATLNQLNSVGYKKVFFAQDQYETYAMQQKNMFHVLIAARTGSGKTELIKLLLMQLVNTCAVRFIHPMFSPVDLVDDEREISCWGPILGKLKNKPEELVENYPKINQLFLDFEQLLSKRAKEKSIEGKQTTWVPAYLVVDEGQIITDHCKDAKRVIGRIVREGRQLKVFIILVCQSAQVQNLGLNKGDLSQFLTKIYLGTDETTRKYLIPELTDELEEKHFTQKGRVAFLSPEYRGLILTQLPLISNEVLYEYFGETFDKSCFSGWLNSEHKLDSDPFEELVGIETEEIIDQNDTSNVQTEEDASNFQFQIEDAISYAIEELRKSENSATMNAVIKKVNDENPFNINSHTHATLVLEVANDYGFEIVEGKAGRRRR